MKRMMLLCCLLVLLSGCRDRATRNELPTLASIDAVGTQVVLTQNAPPAGFDTVAFPDIDANLTALPGWRYEALISFEGVFARTTRPAVATTRLDVSYDQIASARRVVTTVSSNIQGPEEAITYEAVRLGPDTFLVRDGICLSNAGEDADLAADLGAGSLLGGIAQAQTASQRATINSEEVWRYAFDPAALRLPAIDVPEDGRILSLNGELWIAPQHNAVVRYYLTAELENVSLFASSLPVSGTLLLRYDLFDVGVVPNLSVPFGC